MKRQYIAEVLARHRGSAAEIARQLQVSPVSVSQWLSGRVDSKRIGEACKAKAEFLLVQEAKERTHVRTFAGRVGGQNGDKQ